MSFLSISSNFFSDKEYQPKNNLFEEESVLNPLDNSFSLIINEEKRDKNPLDNNESPLQIINNLKNSENDKECSPAPAPLRSSQSQLQNDLGISHNMECPEVIQEENEMNNVFKIFAEEKYNEEELIEKPFDQNLYFYNSETINNYELGDKSAAVNAVPGDESNNSLLNKVNNLDINNCNSNKNISLTNLEESYPAPKNNYIPTPLCSKSDIVQNSKKHTLSLQT